MTDRCECGLLTLYRELAAEYDALDRESADAFDQLEAIRQACVDAILARDPDADVCGSTAGLVRAVIDAITGGREP